MKKEIVLHEPRDPQPRRYLVLAGLYGLLISARYREENTLKRYRSYYQTTNDEVRLVAGLLIQTYMQGCTEIIGVLAVDEVRELAKKYDYSAAEVRQLAIEVYQGTRKDPDFEDDNDARELGEEFRSHVFDWFLNHVVPPTQKELDATAEYYGYWGHEKAFAKLGEQQGEVEQSAELIQALVKNYIDDENDLIVDKLGAIERRLLNDAGIST
jgi:hypothetical protein